MCGRYALTSPEEMAREFGLGALPEGVRPRYNIAPTQEALVVVGGESPQWKLCRWGLVPSWSRDMKAAARMINARAETVHEKPAYRHAFARRRCLVCSDGFYEWKRQGKSKIPHFIRRKDHGPLIYAGIWETYRPDASDPVHTFSVLTTDANELVAQLHDRMPVIIAAEDYDRWLDPDIQAREPLEDLLVPAPVKPLELFEVSPLVNSPANDSTACLRPGPDQKSLF